MSTLPDPFRVRRATHADARGIARVHVDSQEETYAPLAADWKTPNLEEQERKWRAWLDRIAEGQDLSIWVALLEGRIAGFIAGGSCRYEEVHIETEVYVIHVLPDHRGRGVGDELWRRCAAEVREAQLRSMCVRTFSGLRSRSFYESRGGELVASRATTFKGGAVQEIFYRWAQGQNHNSGPES